MSKKKEKLTDFIPQQQNPNKHNERGMGLLENSIQGDGFIGAMTSAEDNEIFAGSARLEKSVEVYGPDIEPIIIESDGTRPVIIKRTDIPNASDPRAKRLSVADNVINQLDLEWDIEVLKDFQNEINLAQWWDEIELQELGLLEHESIPDNRPNPRNLPIDVIYTLQMCDVTCCLAVEAGLKYGIQSAKYRLCPYVGYLSGRHKVEFIDNNYFDYNHSVHLAAVEKFKPKYATVRDLMSKEQCTKEKIKHFSFEQILDWAEELREHAENVIVIPKYDCIEKIPDYFILGYSIPTSHGGTMLPVEQFKGRKVHLLGGSWKEQLKHMAILQDDVVSIDNNYVLMQSNFGRFVYPDGTTGQLTESLGLDSLKNTRYVALAISFGNIGAKISELFGSEQKDIPKIEGVRWR